MQITGITPYLVRANDGGEAERPRGRNWLFVAVETDSGLIGYGEGGGLAGGGGRMASTRSHHS